jgi:hypothetical protein
MDNTILNPSWEEITPSLIELIHGDNDEAAKAAMIDLRRMAILADRAMKLHDLLTDLTNNMVEDIPREQGTRHLWESFDDARSFINPE